MNATLENGSSPKGWSRRQFIITGLLGSGVLTIGAIAFRFTVLPKGAPAVAGGVLTRQELAALDKLAMAHFPAGNAFNLDGREADVAGYVDRYIAQLAPVDQKIIRALIWAYDQGTVLAGHWKPVRMLSDAEARAYVMDWEASSLSVRKDLAMSLRTVLGMAYFAHPKAKAALGIVDPCGSTGPSLHNPGRPA